MPMKQMPKKEKEKGVGAKEKARALTVVRKRKD
jgi:hypothetical protein